MVERFSDVQFCMQHHGIEFSFKACEPVPKDIVAGATLTKLRFKYDAHLDCDDWTSEEKVGYSAWRKANDKPILTDVPRSSSTGRSCAVPSEADRSAETDTQARAQR